MNRFHTDEHSTWQICLRIVIERLTWMNILDSCDMNTNEGVRIRNSVVKILFILGSFFQCTIQTLLFCCLLFFLLLSFIKFIYNNFIYHILHNKPFTLGLWYVRNLNHYYYTVHLFDIKSEYIKLDWIKEADIIPQTPQMFIAFFRFLNLIFGF